MRLTSHSSTIVMMNLSQNTLKFIIAQTQITFMVEAI